MILKFKTDFILDKLMAVIILIFFLPILSIILFITWLDLKANPIFVQVRTTDGLNVFQFFKIRSMKKSAPLVPTNQFVNGSDFITKWGSFLRTWSIDELLNLVSILRGDMKFIGPRPIMTSEIDLIEIRRRNHIKGPPGITGLAQINGRDNITQIRKVACERYYQKNRTSIKLRIHIIITTIKIILNKSGINH